MAEPTNEQRKAIGAFVRGTLSPLIEEVLTKKLSQSATFIADELRREAERAAIVTDAQIQAVWEGMPGGPDGFRKQWGFNQFARAILDLVAHDPGVETPAATLPTEAMLCAGGRVLTAGPPGDKYTALAGDVWLAMEAARTAGVHAAPADWTDDAMCLSGLADRLEEESAAESDRGNDSAAAAWSCRAYELRQIVSRMVRSNAGVKGGAS